ncbi:MAG: EthD family reductase [Allomuricauda sp.]|nr:MAG: EthD family reductase [Allomuricauda sp.]
MKSKSIFLLLFALAHFAMGQESTSVKKGMTKIAILYPSGEGHTFDMEYYATQHMPMVAELFGEPLRHWAIDKGMSGRTPDAPLPYVAVGYFYFDSLEAYEKAFGPNAEKILGDIPNYTNIQPTVQISEVIR